MSELEHTFARIEYFNQVLKEANYDDFETSGLPLTRFAVVFRDSSGNYTYFVKMLDTETEVNVYYANGFVYEDTDTTDDMCAHWEIDAIHDLEQLRRREFFTKLELVDATGQKEGQA